MTAEEFIELQKKDIDLLINLVRAKDVNIEKLKSALEQSKYTAPGCREYAYDVPYFRITSYEIACYALVSYDESHWQSGNIYETYRFTDLFGVSLLKESFGGFRPSFGGRRSFKTCISFPDLMEKLDRRVKRNYKGLGSKYTKLIVDLKKELEKHKNWFSAFFDVELEDGNNG